MRWVKNPKGQYMLYPAAIDFIKFNMFTLRKKPTKKTPPFSLLSSIHAPEASVRSEAGTEHPAHKFEVSSAFNITEVEGVQ